MAAEGVTAAVVTSYTQHKYPILSRYHVGQHPLAKEGQLKKLEPLPETRAAFIKALTREMVGDGQGTLDPHTVKRYQDKMVLEGLGENVDLMYAREFQRWIRGVSVFNEPMLTPWGHRNMFHVPGVVEYLRELIQMRFDYQQSLMHLYMQPAQTLLDLELIYKYIVLQFGLVIPRNDGRVYAEGMPLAEDPRSFMSISGMLSFLDDYQLTSFRDRDLPITDQTEVDGQDKNPNVLQAGNFGADIATLEAVHEGLGPPRLMTNGQPSTNSSNAPTTPPPDTTSAVLLDTQKQLAKLQAAQKRLKEDQAKNEQQYQQKLREMEEAHKAALGQFQTQYTAQVGTVSSEDLTVFAQEQEKLLKRTQAEHDEKLRRLQEDHRRDREDAAGKLAAAKRSMARLESASKVSAAEIQRLADESAELKRKMAAAKTAEDTAVATTKAQTDAAIAEYKRQIEEKDNQIKAASGISSEAWDTIMKKHAGERTKLETALTYWQGQAYAYTEGHAKQIQATEEVQKTLNALTAQYTAVQTEAAQHKEAARLASETAQQAAESAASRKAQLKQAKAELKEMKAAYTGDAEKWAEYEKGVTYRLAVTEQRLQAATEQAHASANDVALHQAAIATLEAASVERDALYTSIQEELAATKAYAAANDALNASAIGEGNKYIEELIAQHARTLAQSSTDYEAALAQKANELATVLRSNEEAGQTIASQADQIAQLTQTLAELQAIVDQAGQPNVAPVIEPFALVPFAPSAFAQHAQASASEASDKMQMAVYNAMAIDNIHRRAVVANGGETTAESKLEALRKMNEYTLERGTTTHERYLVTRDIAIQLAQQLEQNANDLRAQTGGGLMPVHADNRNLVIDSYLNILLVAPPSSSSEEEDEQYISAAAQSFDRTMRTLYSLPDNISFAPMVIEAMMSGDAQAIENAFDAAAGTAALTNAGAAWLSLETMESIRAGLTEISDHFVHAATNHGTTRNNATNALEGVPVQDTARDELNALAAKEIAGLEIAGLDLAQHLGIKSPIFHGGDANLANPAGLGDAALAVQKTIRLVGDISHRPGVSAMSAIAGVSTMVATHLADITQALTGTVQEIETTGRPWNENELGLLRNFIITAASKQALNQLRLNIVNDFAQMVNTHNDTSAFFQYSAEEKAQMNNVYQNIMSEMAELDNQLNRAGYHLVRNNVESGGLQLSASASQYAAAVQIASTPAYSHKSLQLVQTLTTKPSRPATPAVLEHVRTPDEALQLAIVRQDNVLAKAHSEYTAAQFTEASEQVVGAARLALAAPDAYTTTPGQLVVYVADNAARRMGAITQAESQTLDLALLTERDDEDEENITQEKMVALIEARNFRQLAQPQVQGAARELNQLMAENTVPDVQVVRQARIELSTLQTALREMTAKSAVAQVLAEYIVRVENYLQGQRQASMLDRRNQMRGSAMAVA